MSSVVKDDSASPVGTSEPLTGQAAMELLRRGEADYNAGRLDSARMLFVRLIDAEMLQAWAHFFLGRVQRELSQDHNALASFERAIEADDALFWAHYERIALAHRDGIAIDRLPRFAEALVAIRWEPLHAPHVSDLEAIAHGLWDDGKTDLAGKMLAKLWPSSHLSKLSLVRIIESQGDPAVTKAAAVHLENMPELDIGTLRILTDYHQHTGDIDREIVVLGKRHSSAPQDFQTWLALARTWAKKGDREQVNAVMDKGEKFPLRQRSFVTLVTELELGAVDASFYAFRSHARLYRDVPKFPGIRLAYMLSDAFDTVRRDEVIALLIAYHGDDNDVALVRVNAAIRDQHWDTARALFETHFEHLENKPQSVRLAHIDVMAFSGRLQEAADLLRRERIDGICPPAFLRSTLRIMSELDCWDEVLDNGLANLEVDNSFEHFLSVLVRAARKTKRTEALFDALMRLPQPLARPYLDTLHAVMEDLAELGQGDIIDRIGENPLPYEREHRIRLKARALETAMPTEKDLCIYYCADRNYLIPALVSLTALAMSNVSIARRAVFYLVVDTNAVEFAKEAGGGVAARLGLSIEVIDAASVVSSADQLRTGYGIFTGGQQLALAAYYRIFFARYLVDQKRFAKALYVDADTIVRSGIDELFVAETDKALLARYETDRPEVRHATALHQLKGQYFNSGVLLFDLRHPDVSDALDRAIAAAIDPAVKLIFQDQCALNIAFDTKMGELPERFNYFNPPSVSGDGISATDAVIVHFLDRPKPWDSLYRRRAREWFEWFDLVETLRQGLPATLPVPVSAVPDAPITTPAPQSAKPQRFRLFGTRAS